MKALHHVLYRAWTTRRPTKRAAARGRCTHSALPMSSRSMSVSLASSFAAAQPSQHSACRRHAPGIGAAHAVRVEQRDAERVDHHCRRARRARRHLSCQVTPLLWTVTAAGDHNSMLAFLLQYSLSAGICICVETRHSLAILRSELSGRLCQSWTRNVAKPVSIYTALSCDPPSPQCACK